LQHCRIVLLFACGTRAPAELTATVADEWARGCSLTPQGEVAITNSRGSIEVEANGPVQLTLPPTANATLLATATSGRVDIAGLRFDATGEQQPRRVRRRINGGGTPIEIVTVNESIRVAAPGVADDRASGPQRP
jgi:hypothetical protein